MNLIDKWYNKADASAKEQGAEENISVLSGRMANVFIACLKNEDQTKLNEKILALCRDIEKGQAIPNFVEGLAGFGWGVNFCCRNKLVNLNENELFEDLDDYLYKECLQGLKRGNYDYFYGAIGYGLYFLERTRSNTLLNKKLKNIVNELLLLANQEGYWQTNYDVEYNVIDLSLSHGNSSIIAFLSKMVEFDVERKQCIQALHKLIKYYKSITRTNSNKQLILPDCIEAGNFIYSPLRWCHGQLGILVALSNAAKILNDYSIKHYCLDLLQTIIKPTNAIQENLPAPIFCHGTLGVAYCLKKISGNLNEPSMMEAAKFWYKESETTVESHLDYHYKKTTGEIEMGLLNGYEGVALLLMDYENIIPVIGWDECFLM